MARGSPWRYKQHLGSCGISWLLSPQKSSGAPSASSPERLQLHPHCGPDEETLGGGGAAAFLRAELMPAALGCLPLGQLALESSLGDGSEEEDPLA